jgi:hypothetical protein
MTVRRTPAPTLSSQGQPLATVVDRPLTAGAGQHDNERNDVRTVFALERLLTEAPDWLDAIRDLWDAVLDADPDGRIVRAICEDDPDIDGQLSDLRRAVRFLDDDVGDWARRCECR